MRRILSLWPTVTMLCIVALARTALAQAGPSTKADGKDELAAMLDGMRREPGRWTLVKLYEPKRIVTEGPITVVGESSGSAVLFDSATGKVLECSAGKCRLLADPTWELTTERGHFNRDDRQEFRIQVPSKEPAASQK